MYFPIVNIFFWSVGKTRKKNQTPQAQIDLPKRSTTLQKDIRHEQTDQKDLLEKTSDTNRPNRKNNDLTEKTLDTNRPTEKNNDPSEQASDMIKPTGKCTRHEKTH